MNKTQVFYDATKRIFRSSVLVYAVLATIALAVAGYVIVTRDERIAELQDQVKRGVAAQIELDQAAAKVAEEAELSLFVLQLMSSAQARLPDYKRSMITQAIVRVSMQIFDKQEERRQFATVIAIESKFDRNVKSAAGAVGFTQVMPQYVSEFGDLCGIKDVDKNDLYDTDLNLILGACQFRALLEAKDGNVSAALVAYNAGKSSLSLKQLESLSNVSNTETSSYVAKFSYLHQKVRTEVENKLVP